MTDLSEERIEYLRQQLNLQNDVVLVNSGSWGAVAKKALYATAEEIYQDALLRRPAQDVVMKHMLGLLAEYRKEVAAFINCEPEEVAVCESTTGGLNICLWGYDFQPEDEIISGNLENSALFSALNTVVHRRGVKVKYANFGKWGEKDSVQAVREQMTPKTKMVIMSHVSYLTGAAIDIKGISKLCREKGILSVYDGVQGIATLKVDVKEFGCDCYAGASHKFLNGPDGAGFLFISNQAQRVIEPTISGAFTDSAHGACGYSPKATAEKYDVSTRPYYVQAGSMAAIRYFREEVGAETAYSRIHGCREKLRAGLEQIEGVTVLSIREHSDESALVLFKIKGWDEKELSAWLGKQKISCRPVHHYYPPEFKEDVIGVRLAVNYWNTEEDIKKVLEIVHNAAAQKKIE